MGDDKNDIVAEIIENSSNEYLKKFECSRCGVAFQNSTGNCPVCAHVTPEM